MPIETPDDQVTVLTPVEQLCDYVVNRANAGQDVATILAGALEVFSEEPPRRCRQCGCTDDFACLPPCWWVEDDLCSACHPGQSLDLSGAVVAHEGDQVVLMLATRLTLAQADQAKQRLEAQVPGVTFILVDQVQTAIVVDRSAVTP